MSLELHPTDIRQAQALWSAWETGTDIELEATFKTQNLTNWLDVVQHLRSLGLQENPQPPKLNIMVAGGLRFTIVGEDQIQQYCMDNSLKGKLFHVIRKDKKRTGAGSESITEVDWREYGVRIKLRRETTLSIDDPRVREVLGRWATIPKSFRYIQRYSFTSLKHKGLQFDLSMVKQNQKDERGSFIQTTTFTTAEIVKQPMNYEVEVEVLKGTENVTFQSLMVGIATVLRGLQRSFVLTRQTVRKSVLDFLADRTGANKGNFPGPQPVTLERPNVLPSDDDSTPNIRNEDYNVTDKADGQRCLLVVMPSGGIYLIDTNLTVYGTDCRLPKDVATEWGGCILDGEWVRRNADNKPMSKYYAFDIYNGHRGEDVSHLPFIVRTDAPSRYAAMNAAVAILANAERTVLGIPTHLSLGIAVKNFRTAESSKDPLGIFREAAAVLNFVKDTKPYHSDGLIFTPNKSPLPKNMGTWKAQFKWKPSEENSIDFMVSVEKETDLRGNPTASDAITVKVREDTNQIVRCKTLRLYVGSTTPPELLNPRDTILFEKGLPPPGKEDQYKPALFTPQPIDPMASVCYVALDAGATDAAGASDAAGDIEAQDDVIRCVRSGDPITHGSIVEMAYHPNAPPGWRWEPMRVRWDKTERFQRGIMRRTMNSDMVAQSIWSSIHNPVTEHMIRTGAIEESEKETQAHGVTQQAMSKAYYMQKAPTVDQRRVNGLREFHNKYIKEDILLRVLQRGKSLYDMTSGQGGDMHKWHRRGASWVLGTDFAEMNLTENKNGAYRRYADRLIESKGKYTPMLFIQADVSQRLSDGGAGQTPMDRAMLRCLWGAQEADAPPYAQKFRGKAAEGFDVVSIMFSLHYFFKDATMFEGWLTNVAETLKVGGYLVGCCFDGDAVMQFLVNTPVNQARKGIESGVDGDTEIWSITKRYEDATLPASNEGFGKAIDVNFISIGETYTEYLVSWPYLQQRLNEIGLELLSPKELADVGLLSSTNMFEDSMKMAALSGKTFPMTPILKQFSFLNRWFILRRQSMGVTSSIHTARLVPQSEIIQTEIPNEKAPILTVEEVEGLPESEAFIAQDMDEIAPSEVESEPEPIILATESAAPKRVGGDIHKFYQGSLQKDDLKIGDKGWKRWISAYTLYPLQDLENPSIVYPSMEAALTAAKYKYASSKPDLADQFSENGTIHQKYALQRAEKGETISEKEAHELQEKEGDEIHKFAKEAEMKKAGASLNKAVWSEKAPEITKAYVQQRYETDERFRKILDAVKKTESRLVYYTSASPTEFSGVVKGDVIQGQNLLGKSMMEVVGTTY